LIQIRLATKGSPSETLNFMVLDHCSLSRSKVQGLYLSGAHRIYSLDLSFVTSAAVIIWMMFALLAVGAHLPSLSLEFNQFGLNPSSLAMISLSQSDLRLILTFSTDAKFSTLFRDLRGCYHPCLTVVGIARSQQCK